MRISLITPTPPDINAFGVRILSSVLKKAGYQTQIIFFPGGIEHLKFDAGFIYQYPEKVLNQVVELCRDSDLVGFSFMSQYFDRAVQLTEKIKKELDCPVIWGGIHPTVRPEECIRYTDIVCINEGETALLDLVAKLEKGEDYTHVSNCWVNHQGKVIKNPEAPLIQNLDELPFIDFDLEGHYVYNWVNQEIVPVTREVLKENFPRLEYSKDKRLIAYRTMTSRGCPHRCSYCASSSMLQLRRRSVDNVLDELEEMINKFDFIESVNFFDDTFFAAPVAYFEEFSPKYKKRIGLPFYAQCSANTASEKKLDLLVEGGMIYTEMGIQTGSDRIRRMYRRTESNQKILEIATLLANHQPKLLIPDYHVILDNPWETREDVQDTLALLLEIPGPFRLQISSLTFFPGTELNERAKREGLIKDELNEVYRKPFTYPKATYLNYLISLSGLPAVPRGLLKFASRPGFVDLFHSSQSSGFFKFLFALTHKIQIAGKGIRALLTGDFGRIANYFKLIR